MSLTGLPDIRKKIGQFHHLRIYKQILSLQGNFARLNYFLGDVFPANLRSASVSVFFEVRLGSRIPDCIVLLKSVDAKDEFAFHCYFFEFKTTLGKSTMQSVHHNCIHQAQYLQGLRQLHQSISFLDQYLIADEVLWNVVPVICFFRQWGLKLDFFKKFSGKTKRLSFSFICDLFARSQDGAVQSLLSIPNYTNFRRACQKHTDLYRRRYQKASKSVLTKTSGENRSRASRQVAKNAPKNRIRRTAKKDAKRQ
uniref:U49 n=1 Tax=Human betaherpesvirus 6 TaxID=10368 RepID=A0A1W6JE31_9BETA|nr:U49 [Human betaherpesvirus 6]